MSDALIYALAANLFFSLGTIYFTQYSLQFGALRFNTFKAMIALVMFGLSLCFFPLSAFPNLKGIILLSLSGFIGLAIGDICLFSAFKEIGPARTLTLFGLRPMMMGILTMLFFDEKLLAKDTYPTIFFILCLLVFARENYRANKSWGMKGITLAVLGVFLDTVGIVLTRIVFDEHTLMTTFHANFIRTGFAVIALQLICFVRYKEVFYVKNELMQKDIKILLTPIIGTFVALIFFIQAIKTGNLVIVSAIGVTGPIFASVFESIRDKQLPSKHLLLALLFFVLGMGLRFILS